MAKKSKSRSAPKAKGGPARGAKETAKKTKSAPAGAFVSARQAGGVVPIVGVGGSAGGLEAFTHLLEALPADIGIAFVLISHLSHTHKSMLTEILSKTTRMPVTEVKRKTSVEANHVYVISPNADLALRNGVIMVKRARKDLRPHMAIDHFFRSLAEHRKSQAIGVILSGTGTDGTLGLAAIRGAGGITFAQDSESAKYPDMPRSASAGIGRADFVLSPQEIAQEISRLAQHPYVAQQPAGAAETVIEPLNVRQQVFRVVRAATGLDFSQYKRATINRRISRRMVLHKTDRLADYLKRLRSHPDEVEALSQDLLINVTGFFRDAETFEFLKTSVIPKIIERTGDGPIRVWAPACATGEEAYSIAICYLEALGNFSLSPAVQIFATDASTHAIQRARAGVYPENIAQDISTERLRRFFVRDEKGFEIGKMVRDLCVFSVQNVVKDPPFSRLDLISCRNLLIYLEPELQQKVLATFHYALKPSGYLLLGGSETPGTSSELFEEASKKHRIYSKIASAVPLRSDLLFGGRETSVGSQGIRPAPRDRKSPDIQREVDRLLVDQYSPPGLVVNPAMDIVEFRGDPSRFWAPAAGKASLNVFKTVRQNLIVDLRAAIHQAKKSGAPVRKEGTSLDANDGTKKINLVALPLKGEASEGHYLVLFEDAATKERRDSEKPASPPEKPARGKLADYKRENERLRRDLAAVQEHLHSIIEDQEATNEELQSANEEILSSNEELQSINEELETAKEELQATNEELNTVNDELHHRNEELTEANDDLSNLFESMDIAYLMLSTDLRIRRFTAAAKKLFNLIPSDVNRPISDINASIEAPNLTEIIAEVIDRIAAKELEVQDADGRWYSMRIRPYRTKDKRIAGAILALLDIDALKRGREALRESEAKAADLRSLLEDAPDFILDPKPEGRVLFINRTFASLANNAVVGESIYDYLDADDHEAIRRCLEEVRATGETSSFETRGIGPLRATERYITRVGPLKSEGGIVGLTLVTGQIPANKRKLQRQRR